MYQIKIQSMAIRWLYDPVCEDRWCHRNENKFSDRYAWANSADPDQTAPRAVWSGSTLIAISSASFGLITLW